MRQLLEALSYCNSQIKYYNFGISKSEFYKMKEYIVRQMIEHAEDIGLSVKFNSLELQKFKTILIAIQFTIDNETFGFHQVFHSDYYCKLPYMKEDIPIHHFVNTHNEMKKDNETFEKYFKIIEDFYNSKRISLTSREIVNSISKKYPTLTFRRFRSRKKGERIEICGEWKNHILHNTVRSTHFCKNALNHTMDEYLDALQ